MEKQKQQRLSPSSIIINDDLSIGYFYALVHVIKGVIGVGLFAMGFAVKNGGIFVGPPLIFIFGVTAVHCQHLLVNCAEKVSEYAEDDEPLGYAAAIRLCIKNGPEKFSSWARAAYICVNICICITQFGFCCVYLVFIAENISQVLKSNGKEVNLRLLILIAWIPSFLVSLITNLKALAPVSMLANFLISSSFIATITCAYMGKLKDISELRPHATPWEYAIFLGTVIFGFETIALVLPVRNAMRYPKNFSAIYGVLNVGMVIVMTMYLTSGITGYLRWGEEVKGSLTLNLDDTIYAQCIKIAVSGGIMFTYPLHFYVPIKILLPGFLTKFQLTNRELLGELIFRSLMTICTVIIAELVPKIDLFITLIGALCSTALALVFPPLTECLLLHKSVHSRFVKYLIIIKNIYILILALMAFTISTTISVMEIVKSYLN